MTFKKYSYLVGTAVFIAMMTTIFEKYYRRELYLFGLCLQGFMTPQVIICYMLIYKAIRRQRKVQVSVGSIEGHDRAQIRKQKEDKSKAYTMGIIIIFHLVCYGPPLVTFLFILDLKGDVCNLSSNGFTLSAGLSALLLLNSAVNPIVYSLRIKEMRNAACRLVGRRSRVTQNEALQDVTRFRVTSVEVN